jgi:hypothetical protein
MPTQHNEKRQELTRRPMPNHHHEGPLPVQTGCEGVNQGEMGRERNKGRHHPPPAPRATACGVERGWTDEREGHERTPRNERQPSTCPQPCEPLLAGWIAGANGHVTTPRCDDSDGRGGWEAQTNAMQHDNPAPTPSPASHCSQGGLRVLTAT